jgi:AraC-like DNA-binding protein
MLDQIHQNYPQRLTLTTLARRLERQSAYLGKLFRDEIGVTVHGYITRAQMMFGAAQVRSGVKLEAVALDLGYRIKKNFYRQFKRRFGMTPEAYRYHQSDVARDGSVAPASRQTLNGRTIASLARRPSQRCASHKICAARSCSPYKCREPLVREPIIARRLEARFRSYDWFNHDHTLKPGQSRRR